VLWPKANEERAWKELDEEVCGKLALGGRVMDRLDELCMVIHEVGAQKFGVKVKDTPRSKVFESRRQLLIKRLKKEKKELRKRWRTSEEQEKVGIGILIKELQQRLMSLMRAERLRNKKVEKRKANDGFIKNPYGYAKGLFRGEKSGKLGASKEEVDEYLQKTYSDCDRDVGVVEAAWMVRPTCPGKEFNLSDITLKEVREVVKKARGKSAAGPNGISYKVYKRCPSILKVLWNLLRIMWKKKAVHPSWQIAEGVFIPKEENSVKIEQFRPIALLNVEGKVFFSIVARRLTRFLLENGYIDTFVQKAGIPGFSGCLEHSCIIWEQIKKAKRDKGDVAVVWLDLVNAYGSVPHKVVEFALEFFWVPEGVRELVKDYFNKFFFRFSTGSVTSGWQRLEIGIAMGCAISPMLFVMVMELLIKGGKAVGKGMEVAQGCNLPPLRAFMDDITVVEEKYEQAKKVVAILEEAVIWGRMKFKAVKCRSLVLSAGKVVSRIFHVHGSAMPTVQQQGVKSLGRWYKYPVSDRGRGKELQEQAENGLRAIDKSCLNGKWKCWCHQQVLLPKLLWPLLVYDIPLSRVESVEKKISAHLRKWLGVPRCLSSVALYNKTLKLQLPFTSIVDEFKVGKVRLHLLLSTSEDRVTQLAEPEIVAGRKWCVTEAVGEAESRVRFEQILGHVQTSRSGIGWGRSFSKQSSERSRVCDAVRRKEEEARVTKAVQLSSQGRIVAWEGVVERKINWSEFWKIDPIRVGFLVKSVYDCLPTKVNLGRWGLSESTLCSKCQAVESLEHVLCACKVALSEGRFTWRHNKVLDTIRQIVRSGRIKMGKQELIKFVREGAMPKRGEEVLEEVDDTGELWEVRVDLEKRLVFPQDIVVTTLRPDMVLMHRLLKRVVIMELTVPWEDRMDEAHERKSLKYEDLRQACVQAGWKASCYAVEVGCRGFAGLSLRAFLRDIGVSGKQLRIGIERAAAAAEKASAWLWLKRGEGWYRGV
jgi:hypothetical protein